MYDDEMDAASLAALRQALARELGQATLSEAQDHLLAQVHDDLVGEDLADVDPADVAHALADVWRFADLRSPGEIKLRLVHAEGAGGRDLKLDLLEIVQDDVPFLVDSVMGALAAAEMEVRAMVHPVLSVQRDDAGLRVEAGRPCDESMIMVGLHGVGEDRREALLEALRLTLADVHAAARDGSAMHELMRQVAVELTTSHAPFGAYGVDEYAQFLQWLSSDRFIFLGARAYDYPRTPDGEYAAEEPHVVPGASLGLLRDPELSVLRRANEPAILTPALATYLDEAEPLIVAKSTLKSRVHRRSYLDYVGVKRYDAQGRAVGETRFVGLFTAAAYEDPAHHLPLVRRKIEHVLARSGANPSGHSGNRLRDIVETYPRDELFQIDEDALCRIATGVLHLFDRPRVKLFWRVDPFARFVSALLYVPLNRFDSDLQVRAGRMLASAWGGRVSAVYPHFSDQPLARLHYIIGISPTDHLDADLRQVEARIADAARSWSDRFEAAAREGGVARGQVGPVLARYAGAFPPGYRDLYDAAEALRDLAVMERVGDPADLRIRAFRREDDARTRLRLKLYRPGRAVPLAEVLPILENMGLKAMAEEGFPVARVTDDAAGDLVWVHEFVLDDERGERLLLADVKTPFEETFLAVWTGATENDGFNRLVLEIGASWREVALVRALARYRQQSGLDPSQAVQEAALSDHAGIARLVLDLFRVKFDPAVRSPLETRRDQAEAVFGEILEALQAVESLDADRVLRRLALLVEAMTRTNFFQSGPDGAPKPYISFKVDSRRLEDLPAPKPYREIFVWAPHVEGVHLRFGPVARGGLRWSDRRDDFRTEVLGLVKAQQVKNAVIVPVGSKGGFYPKKLPKPAPKAGGAPDAVREEGVRAYRTFLSGLLDLTDNLDASGDVLRPADLIAYDGDDPYLVVAADKGTATFSDIANGVARDYGFWLDDAFASGGSAGYDHKAMGITARGAWEAVKRHFREMGKDIAVEPFTCIGVGDMSGDVFGNGALLSKAMKLVAAFNHRHVFLDPDPDPEAAWAERRRLFTLPRSSWADYDRALISRGGGVFARTAKSVPVSAEVRAWLGVEHEALAPADLISAILKAEAELLYLGGIGTYVKAASESHAEAGDKANDAVRIDATDLRVKVVGEGANLGITQAGRISFARAGGRIDTDAIDNSAGVDTSDHEVNIKILLSRAIADGALPAPERDGLLASMTNEVAAHVLRHNYDQTLGLSLQEAAAAEEIDAHAAFMLDLERRGRLSRRVEGLPGAADLADLRAAGRGLTRPELSVITAYGKLELSAQVVRDPIVDDPYFIRTLKAYFPRALDRLADQMERHRLRRDIIATVLANAVVDKAGPTFAPRVMAALDGDVGALVAAFETAVQVFRLDEAWREVNALDYRAPASIQTRLYRELARTLRGQTYWLCKRAERGEGGVQALIDAYRPALDVLRQGGEALLSSFERDAVAARRATFVKAGAPDDLAGRIALLGALTGATGIADLSRELGWTADAVARLYSATGSAFAYDRLRAAAASVQAADGFERAALRGLIVELIDEQLRRTRAVAESSKVDCGADLEVASAAVAAWIAPRQEAMDRARRVVEDIERAAGGWSFAKLTLATAGLRAV